MKPLIKRVLSALVIGMFLSALSISPADARSSGGSRTYYGGGKHSSSHGGHYQGGKGSSHKGGTYKNPKTGDRYGKHK